MHLRCFRFQFALETGFRFLRAGDLVAKMAKTGIVAEVQKSLCLLQLMDNQKLTGLKEAWVHSDLLAVNKLLSDHFKAALKSELGQDERVYGTWQDDIPNFKDKLAKYFLIEDCVADVANEMGASGAVAMEDGVADVANEIGAIGAGAARGSEAAASGPESVVRLSARSTFTAAWRLCLTLAGRNQGCVRISAVLRPQLQRQK